MHRVRRYGIDRRRAGQPERGHGRGGNCQQSRHDEHQPTETPEHDLQPEEDRRQLRQEGRRDARGDTRHDECLHEHGRPAKSQRDPRAQMPADHGRWRIRTDWDAHAQPDRGPRHRHSRVPLVQAAFVLRHAIDDVTHRRQLLGSQEANDAGHQQPGEREDRARCSTRRAGQGQAPARRGRSDRQVDGLVEQPDPDRGDAAEREGHGPQADMAPQGHALDGGAERPGGHVVTIGPTRLAEPPSAGLRARWDSRPGCPARPRRRTWSPCPSGCTRSRPRASRPRSGPTR